MKKLNKKGFTLVELLAVIVILAVVMLIGVTAVGPLMTKARKNAVLSEAETIVSAARTAYQVYELSGKVSTLNKKYCITITELAKSGYYDKQIDTSTKGYALITVTDKGVASYGVAYTNGTFQVKQTTTTNVALTIGNVVAPSAADVIGGCPTDYTALTATEINSNL